MGAQITGAGLANLSNLHHCKLLILLSAKKITDAGLFHLWA